MKDKVKLLKKVDKTFLLKMIMVADLNTSAYKFLSKHQAELTKLEANPNTSFSDEYLNEMKDKDGKKKEQDKEVLEKILKIIRTEPISSKVETRLSKIFDLVGFFEELQPETVEFNKLAFENPDEAIKLLMKIEWDFDSRISSLVAETSQDAGKLNFEIAQVDDQQKQVLNAFQKRTSTMLKIFEIYSQKEGFLQRVGKISSQFFSIFPPLADKLGIVLGNLEPTLLNNALALAPESFWQDLMSQNTFKDFNNFERVILVLDNQKFIESSMIKALCNRLGTFFEPNFDQVIKLTRDKNILKSKSSTELQSQLARFFTTQSDADRRTIIFDIFTSTETTQESSIIIIDDLISKSDYQKLEVLLNNVRLSQLLTSSRLEQFKSFLLTADFGNDQFQNLLTLLWAKENIEKFKILESTFFDKMTNKIIQISDTVRKKKYMEILINPNLKDLIRNLGVKSIYIEGLETIKANFDSKLKARITRFQTSLKGGAKNVRRTTKQTRARGI